MTTSRAPVAHQRLWKWLPVAFFAILPAILLQGLLAPGYIFSLDMIPPEYFRIHPQDLLRPGAVPIVGADFLVTPRLPLLIMLSGLSSLGPVWLVQKLVLWLILFLAGFSAYRLAPTRSLLARLFAGSLYAVNPFIYVRLLVGQWQIALGYALLPLAVKSFTMLLEELSWARMLRALLWTVLVGIASLHMAALLFFVLVLFWAAKTFSLGLVSRRAQLRAGWVFLLALGWAVANLYWLLPGVLAQQTLSSSITRQDLSAFLPSRSLLTSFFSVASMHGFWRPGYTYASDLFSLSYLFFFPILFLAVLGSVLHFRSPYVRAMILVYGASLLLARGTAGPLAGLLSFLFDWVEPFRAFRDSQKFVALLALAYVYLGSLGMEGLVSWVWEASSRGMLRLGTGLAATLCLASPFILGLPMFGFAGDLKPTDYPEEWYEARDFLNRDPQDFNVLFLPWHLYMDFSWLPNRDKRIANPAAAFFEKPVIQGQNIELPGIYSESTNPGQKYVEDLLAQRDNMKDLGARLRLLNVKYVMLAKEVDYKKYGFLYQQEDLKLVMEGMHLALFENQQPVARLYETNNRTGQAGLNPLDYTRAGAVQYRLESPGRAYVVFVPPDLNPAGWTANGRASESVPQQPFAVYASGSREVMIGDAGVPLQLASYGLSLTGLAVLVGLEFFLVWRDGVALRSQRSGFKP